MPSNDTVQELIAALSLLEQKGHRVVGIASLLELLTVFRDGEEDDEAARLDAFVAAQQQVALEKYRAEIQAAIEASKATTQAGQHALRTAILTNGGAAVALMAFLGSGAANTAQLPEAMLSFVAGVLFAAVATGTTYLAAFAASRRKRRWFHTANSLSCIFVSLAYAAFVVGGFVAYQSLRQG